VSYLGRLLDVLDLVVADDLSGVGLTELSARIGMPLSTSSRLIGLLADRGYVTRTAGGGFAPGARLVQMGLRANDRLEDTDRLDAAVRELAARTGESVSAGLLVGDSIVLTARRESEESLRAVARVGDVITPHTSAMGKAVLAHLPVERRLAVLRAAGLDPEAVHGDLRDELAETRRTGVGIDEQTYAVGLRCRAAPIVGRDGVAFGGISIAGPAARFTRERADACIDGLVEVARRLSLQEVPS
jgi:DNA-binding IclR family transcriptional regulator